MNMTSLLLRKLDDARQNGVYIYGQGSFSARVTQILESIGIEIIGYINNFELQGNISEERSSGAANKKIVFLGFHNYLANISEICEYLIREDFSIINPVEFSQIVKYFGIEFENYWLTNRFEIYENNSSKIECAEELFKEKKSNSLFHNIIEFRKSGKIDYLKAKDNLENQYFPTDFDWILSAHKNKSEWDVLDGGAFHGETYDSASEKINISNWKFVEPDLNNVEVINDKYGATHSNIAIIPKALYSQSGKVSFSQGITSFGSRISEVGSEQIETTSIDDIYQNGDFNVDLIKLDVEGSEIEVLVGGTQTLLRRKPYLAIAVYHKPEDHWEIPLFIANEFPFYDFHLRIHGEQSFDTVLYCSPITI